MYACTLGNIKQDTKKDPNKGRKAKEITRERRSQINDKKGNGKRCEAAQDGKIELVPSVDQTLEPLDLNG